MLNSNSPEIFLLTWKCLERHLGIGNWQLQTRESEEDEKDLCGFVESEARFLLPY